MGLGMSAYTDMRTCLRTHTHVQREGNRQTGIHTPTASSTVNAPEVGSSSRRIEGSASSSVAMFRRLRSPPEMPVVGLMNKQWTRE